MEAWSLEPAKLRKMTAIVAWQASKFPFRANTLRVMRGLFRARAASSTPDLLRELKEKADKKVEEEVLVRMKDAEEAVLKRKTDEEASARKKEEEEALLKKKAEEDSQRRRMSEQVVRPSAGKEWAMDSVVNLEAFPLHDLQSAQGRELVVGLQQDLRTDGYAVLRRFLNPAAVSDAVQEVLRRKDTCFVQSRLMNMWGETPQRQPTLAQTDDLRRLSTHDMHGAACLYAYPCTFNRLHPWCLTDACRIHTWPR